MLPISVIVPHRRSRWKFFQNKCLPSIFKNEPAQIIVESWEGGAPEKRNCGAMAANQPYLYFVDDDAILRPNCLSLLHQALKDDPGAAFAYCDTTRVLYRNVPYPFPKGPRYAKRWSLEDLYYGNYVDTMSLFRYECFPGFDPKIKRFQDWDLFLTLGEAGSRGAHVPEILFEQHHFDVGISMSFDHKESVEVIRQKHPKIKVV